MNIATTMLAGIDPAKSGALASLEFPESWPECLGLVLLVTMIVVPLLLTVLYLAYFAISLPLRRQERARLFLDLLESGLERGESPERTVLSVARQRGARLGREFRRFAARLEDGLRCSQALELTPDLLPRHVTAMLRAGLELGNVRQVVPGCRRLLRDGATRIWNAHHYVMLLAFVISPLWVTVFTTLCVFVLPKLQQVAADLDAPAGGLMILLTDWRSELIALQLALLAGLWLGALLYCGGPKLTGWLARTLPFSWDRLAASVPWHRHRMQRDFSTILAVGLDAGLPESRAVMLAGEGTANEVFRARAVAAVQDLQRGLKLPEALARLDESGAFRWRLENAAFGRGGFLPALAGWQEALDARAFQEEQTAAQLATTGLVLLNGLLVALIAVGVFGMLIKILWAGILW